MITNERSLSLSARWPGLDGSFDHGYFPAAILRLTLLAVIGGFTVRDVWLASKVSRILDIYLFYVYAPPRPQYLGRSDVT